MVAQEQLVRAGQPEKQALQALRALQALQALQE
jgi:hypothetical protein